MKTKMLFQRLDTETKREIAKAGMIASLGVATISGFMMKNKTAKTLHFSSAVALIGFSIWHHNLYPKKRQKSNN